MKALVVGCGSIGRRHITNLIASDRIEEIMLYTGNKECMQGIDDKGKTFSISSLDDVNADFGVIANETYKHADTALKLAAMGIHLFIEKPLSHNTDKIDLLRKTAGEKGVKIFIAYNLRFLGTMNYMKKLLAENALGDIYFVKIEVGQYLPFWRKGTDYRNSYSASSARGGGIALDLSHELDYMRYLFGEPSQWKTMRLKAGGLEMDAENIFEGLYLYNDKFICNVHMDCLQKDVKRSVRIEGSKGALHCDFIKKELTVSSENGNIILNDTVLFDINRTYVDEMSHFMDVVEKSVEPAIGLEDGLAVLKLIEDNCK